jgi:hypothetical protein
MKRILVLLLVFAIALGTVPAYAAQKGASSKAYEKASDEAVFNRVGDWFATRGKSPKEAQAILGERKAKRAMQRTQKEAEKQKKIAKKQAEQSQKEMNRKMKKGSKR